MLNTTEVDTFSWSRLSGSFVAAGDESYITIGNFRGLLDPDTVYVGPTTLPVQRAMYYIDALELRPCEVSVPELESGRSSLTYDPATRRLSITAPQDAMVGAIALQDMAGRVVYRHAGNSPMVQLALHGLLDGVYVVRAGPAGALSSARVLVY